MQQSGGGISCHRLPSPHAINLSQCLRHPYCSPRQASNILLHSSDTSESGVAAKVADAGLRSYLLAADPHPPYLTMAASDGPAPCCSDGPDPFVVGSRSGSGSNSKGLPGASSSEAPLLSGVAYLAPELMLQGGGGPPSKASDVSAVGGSTGWQYRVRANSAVQGAWKLGSK